MSTTITDQHPGTLIYAQCVRTRTVPGIRDAIAASMEKLAKRIPGLTARIEDTAYTPPAGHVVTWCETHRAISCTQGSDPQAATCYQAPTSVSNVEVYIDGLPLHNGVWELAGVLTRDGEGVIQATSIDVDSDGWASGLTHLMGQCDHCGKTRRRNTTVLLRSTVTREVLPVGKTCLTEYTGGLIRVQLLAALTELRERFAAEVSGVIATEAATAPVVDVVALAIRYVALHGFVRSTDDWAGSVPTVRRLEHGLFWLEGQGARPEVMVCDLSAADRAAAREAIALITASDDTGDYMTNLRAVVAVEWTEITGRRTKLGLLASLPGAAHRLRERTVQTAAGPDLVNAWIGETKQRREFTGLVTLRKEIELDDEYRGGTRWVTMMIVETPEGCVKVFGQVAGIEGCEAGDTVTLTGTIAKHTEYRGRRQTQINRVKIAPKK